MTFTTAAFDRSSSWRFEAFPYRTAPKGPPSSLVQHGALAAFPQPHPRAVAAPTIGGDQQSGCLGIARPTDGAPPLADAIDGERGRVMVNADTPNQNWRRGRRSRKAPRG